MNEIPIPYPGCDHGGKGTFGQSVQGARLVWHRSYSCPVCGAAEEDGDRFPPENLREAVLERDGHYKLVSAGTDRLATVRTIRAALRHPMQAMTTLLAQFPLLYVGSETETVWLKAVLAEAGLASQASGCDTGLSEAERIVDRLMSAAARQSSTAGRHRP